MEKMKSVGSRIKQIRESKMIAIEDFSERSGLSVDQIELIESDSQLPSLSPLIKMARALGVRLGTFLDDNDNLGPVVCHKEDHMEAINFSHKTANSHNNLTFYSLAEKKAGRSMEPFIINVESASKEGYELSSHEGEEFLFVLKGSIEVSYGKHDYLVKEGDSIYYDSIVEHNVHAATQEGATILAVVYTPF